jgi:hypothetical protein
MRSAVVAPKAKCEYPPFKVSLPKITRQYYGTFGTTFSQHGLGMRWCQNAGKWCGSGIVSGQKRLCCVFVGFLRHVIYHSQYLRLSFGI